VTVNRAANAAGLVRINVMGLAAEGIGILVDADSGERSFDRSAINSWCDGYQRIIGSQYKVGEKHQREGCFEGKLFEKMNSC
jgi:hypothetical protein